MSSDDIGSAAKVFGERVRNFRKRRFLSQDTLATRAGLSQSEISKIEKGVSKDPSVETIRKLAKGLELEPEDLVRTTTYAALFGQIEILPVGTVTEGPPILVYFASALTGLEDDQLVGIKALDEKVDAICRSYPRYPLVLYRPRTETSPQDNPEIPAREVYDIDQERVAASDLLVLAAVFPSFGAGMELQLALQSCSSVILLKKKEQKLSRMVIGCPARMKIVEYEELDELDDLIRLELDTLVPLISEFRFSVITERSDGNSIGGRIRHIREQRGWEPEDLARIVGLDVAYIQSIETQPEEIINPSLQILRRISRALNIAEAFLITGHETPIQHQNPIFASHQQSLDAYATEMAMPVDEYRELWRQHVDRYAPEFSVLGVDRRLEVGDRRYWIERHAALKKDKKKSLLTL